MLCGSESTETNVPEASGRERDIQPNPESGIRIAAAEASDRSKAASLGSKSVTMPVTQF
jgi:hypothetical protein